MPKKILKTAGRSPKRPALPAPLQTLPMEAASGYRVVVVFLKSRARSFEIALATARQAPIFREAINGKKESYLAAFDLNDYNISKIVILLTETLRLVGTQLLIDGKPVQGVDSLKALNTLRCYGDSFASANTDAYCAGEGDIAFDRSVQTQDSKLYFLPCRIISSLEYKVRDGDKVSVNDQVQALAVKEYCHFCPKFDLGRLRKTGNTNIIPWDFNEP